MVIPFLRSMKKTCLAIALLALFAGMLAPFEYVHAAWTAGQWINASVNNVGGTAYIRSSGGSVRSFPSASSFGSNSPMRGLLSAMIDAGGGEVSEQDIAALAAMIVNPYFTNASPASQQEFLMNMQLSTPEMTAAVRQYFNTNPQFAQNLKNYRTANPEKYAAEIKTLEQAGGQQTTIPTALTETEKDRIGFAKAAELGGTYDPQRNEIITSGKMGRPVVDPAINQKLQDAWGAAESGSKAITGKSLYGSKLDGTQNITDPGATKLNPNPNPNTICFNGTCYDEPVFENGKLVTSKSGVDEVATNDLKGFQGGLDDTPICEQVFGVGPLSPEEGSQSIEWASGDQSESGKKTGDSKTTCTSYTYSDWSACVNSQQTRTIKTKTPSGCTNTTTATLSQSCTDTTICTSYTYNDWSACANGQQSRTIKTQTPAGCTDASTATLSQSCADTITCTSYTYNDWSACANNTQSRTIKTQTPSGCTNTATAILTQPCTVGVVACVSYTYSDWSDCANGQQTRSIKTRLPEGCETSSAVFSQPCTAAVAPNIVNITNAVQTIGRPTLAVATDRSATCQYNGAGDFSYGRGTTFDTTGGFSHNSSLPGMASGAKTYYVICQDNATGGVSNAFKVEFRVDLSADPANAPIVVNVTPATQTGGNPVLAATTDRPAICQYKKDSTFNYGSGNMMATDDNYRHSVSIASLADGSYSFYIICKDNATGVASAAMAVAAALSRAAVDESAPVVTSTTNTYQTVKNPVLSITTDKAAICQYKKGGAFVYGSGTQFAADEGTSHSVQLDNASDGQQVYYAVCKYNSAGPASAPLQIVFTVNAGTSDVCLDLSSNDRKNDANRSYFGDADTDSTYLWQSVETGTRDKFKKVDWFAGYQFTPEIDGKIVQLCGYFESGVTNKVSIYSGSYAELASAQVAGNGAWKCANINPLEIKADKRYYVIARVKDNPIYYENKSGMLPKTANNAVIEAGIRQTKNIDNGFKSDIVKYDHMIFGLVDVKVSWAPASIAGPAISSAAPSGTISGSSAMLALQTDQSADCKFDREDTAYSKMSYTMPRISANNHGQKICGLENGSYTFYVRCKSGAGAENNGSGTIQFVVAQ